MWVFPFLRHNVRISRSIICALFSPWSSAIRLSFSKAVLLMRTLSCSVSLLLRPAFWRFPPCPAFVLSSFIICSVFVRDSNLYFGAVLEDVGMMELMLSVNIKLSVNFLEYSVGCVAEVVVSVAVLCQLNVVNAVSCFHIVNILIELVPRKIGSGADA